MTKALMEIFARRDSLRRHDWARHSGGSVVHDDHGAIHVAVALVSFAGGIVGMFVHTRTFERDARRQKFWPVSLALALAALIAFFLQGEGSWMGLYQRMLVGTITLWLILVAFRLRSIAGAAATDPGKSTRHLPGQLGVAKRTRRDRTDATGGCKGSGVGHA